ncbi:MAG: tRNA dihydrouridine synthase DusB [Acidobacteriota bacterium]
MNAPPGVPPPLRIGGVTIDPPLLLAPMAGVTDHHFRLIVRRIGGVGLVSMEFLPAAAMVRGIEPVLRKLHFTDEERPLAIQIYGRDPEEMRRSAAIVERLRPDVCDINMGCPANKILKNCAGAALMGDLRRAARMIALCRRELTIPLTVKFRLGTGRTGEPLNYLELGRICEDLGVDAVTMHARTAKQMYRGRAAWEHLARLKQALRIPVIGNGDVRTPDDALRMFAETGVDGVMIGRAVLTDPFVFRRIAAALAGRHAPEPTPAERLELIRTHFRWILRDEPPRLALHKLRSFLGRYTHGLPEGRALRRRISELDAPEQFLPALEQHLLAHAASGR